VAGACLILAKQLPQKVADHGIWATSITPVGIMPKLAITEQFGVFWCVFLPAMTRFADLTWPNAVCWEVGPDLLQHQQQQQPASPMGKAGK
jgi:hypothetical protein